MLRLALQAHSANYAALGAFALALWVWMANRRRLLNRFWAAALCLCGVWEASIAVTSWYHSPVLYRQTFIVGGIVVLAVWLLSLRIITPWRPLAVQLRQMWPVVAGMPVYLLAETPGFLVVNPQSPDGHWRVGWAFWLLHAFSFACLIPRLAANCRVIRGRKLSGVVATELAALSILIVSMLLTIVLNLVLRYALHLGYLARYVQYVNLLAFVPFTFVLSRSEIFDAQDLRRVLAFLGARAAVYLPFGALFACAVISTHPAEPVEWTMLVLGSLFMLFAAPAADRRLRRMVDASYPLRDFFEAQSETAALMERVGELSELHAGFLDVLRRWSRGSPVVVLFDGAVPGSWPYAPIPDSIFAALKREPWASPELLERRTGAREALDYLIEYEIAAFVAHTSRSGERLIAVFSERAGRQPFTSRELREARELLQLMHFGLSWIKLNQQMRSKERLGFYAQYGAQFAHEIRNRLYLQRQLLRELAEGRGAYVMARDAHAAIGGLEDLERLCRHFSTVGALYDRPTGPCHLNSALSAIARNATSAFSDRAQLQLSLETPDELYVVANADLLEMALMNLVKNGVEALRRGPRQGRVEIAAARAFETVRIGVRDNGPGLPPDRRRDPFVPGPTQKADGFGLGLSIARSCVEAMGGTIALRSSGDDGTCFEIALNCCSCASP